MTREGNTLDYSLTVIINWTLTDLYENQGHSLSLYRACISCHAQMFPDLQEN